MKKPDFKDLYFDDSQVVWGVGNNIMGPNLIARIKFRELNDEEENEEKLKYYAAKEIYETYFNKGQKFKPSGKTANKNIECKITFIHSEKQLITWKQTNLTKEQIENGLKPATGKWFINAMLKLVKTKEIEFLN